MPRSPTPFASVLEWFRDDDGDWTTPDGRRLEFVALAVGLPAFAWYVPGRLDLSVPSPWTGTWWLVAALGVCGGFCYAVFVRDAVVDAVPTDGSGWTVISLLGSSVGVSIFEHVPAAGAAVLFLLVAGAATLAIYLLRLLSPFHRGLEPARRGVEPPTAIEE